MSASIRSNGAGSRQNWRTPKWLINALWTEFGIFDLDGAADEDNTLAYAWLGPGGGAEDALNLGPNVSLIDDARIFVNPPYNNLGPWIDAFAEWRTRADIVVALLPNSTETRWFRRLAEGIAHEIRFLTQRVQFELPPTEQPGAWAGPPAGTKRQSNPNGSIIAVMRPETPPAQAAIRWWDARQEGSDD